MLNHEAHELVGKAFQEQTLSVEELVAKLHAAGWYVSMAYLFEEGRVITRVEIASIHGPRCHTFGGCWEGDLNAKQWSGMESIPQALFDKYHATMRELNEKTPELASLRASMGMKAPSV
jgi:hypothetical protein